MDVENAGIWKSKGMMNIKILKSHHNMSGLTIDISTPKAQFERHLQLDENRRIIFSGPFGSGKTYFLRNFFEGNERFTVIRLAPINYSIAQNEDIFELIKFDILFHLLENEVLPKHLNFSKTDVLRSIYLLDPEKGIRGILEKANKLGVNALPFFLDKNTVSVVTKNIDQTESSSIELDWLDELKKLFDKIVTKQGGIYDYDMVTKLLFYLISNLNDEKEVVLVIDDLDRIDPEHIFRILNVFAAHFDLNETDNKFGFSRVILVCDLANIRRVFANRYGLDVDFSGYIDKFYSQEVFCFNNNIALRKKISGLLETVKVNFYPDGKPDLEGHFPIQSYENSHHRIVAYTLEALIHVNGTNLRSLERINNQTFEIEHKGIGRGYQSKEFPIIWTLEFLISVLGDGISLRNGIQKCVSSMVGLEIYDGLDQYNHLKIGLIIPPTLIPNKMDQEKSHYSISEKFSVQYELRKSGPNQDSHFARIRPDDKRPVDIFPPLLEVIDIFQRIGLLL